MVEEVLLEPEDGVEVDGLNKNFINRMSVPVAFDATSTLFNFGFCLRCRTATGWWSSRA